MKLSVLIRNRNEEGYIGHCIQSIVDFLGEDVQVVLVDNDSIDNSIRIVNTFDYLKIDKIFISKNEYSPGKALNRGIEKCDGDIIMIISAHCEIIEFNVDEVIKDLTVNSGISVWGKQIPIWDGKKITRRYMWSNFGDESKINYFCKFEDRYFLHNGFSFYMKKILKEFPFDERLSGKEDRYWANDRIKEGHQIIYNPNLTVKHHYTINGATWKGTG